MRYRGPLPPTMQWKDAQFIKKGAKMWAVGSRDTGMDQMEVCTAAGDAVGGIFVDRPFVAVIVKGRRIMFHLSRFASFIGPVQPEGDKK